MSGPTWHAFENPALAELPDLARAQVVQQINCQLIAELVAAAGGEVILPPGFAERVGSQANLIITKFLPDGSYRVLAEPLHPVIDDGAQNATLWERMAGPRRRPEREVYGVAGVEPGDPYRTLRRLDPDTGAAIDGKPLVRVKADHLVRGLGGWRRFKPADETIEAVAGRPSPGPLGSDG